MGLPEGEELGEGDWPQKTQSGRCGFGELAAKSGNRDLPTEGNMEKPRIRHIAINVEDLDKTAEYYKRVFGMEEKHRRPGGTIYLSDGHFDLALIHSEKYPWGIHHFGFKVDSVKEIEKIADTKAEDNTYGAIAESWIKDVEGNRVDVSEHGWPI
jgi:catechol 2,3-dioxygenase-like lactoylglutathione lyase family enzyme